MATIVPNAAGGNWSAGGTWVGGVAPTAADDVDYSALTGTLTIDGTSGSPNLCRSFTATASTGTLSHLSAKQLNIGDGTTGHFKLVSGLTYAPNVGGILKFVSTASGNQITTAAKRVPTIIFDGIGGIWTFQDACNNVTSATITLTNGALDTGGFNFGATSGVSFSSNNSNTRSLTMGATTWTLPAASGSWDIGTSTGMTLSAASSTINTLSGASSVVFNGGGLTYGTFSSTIAGASGTPKAITFDGGNTFATLTLTGQSNSNPDVLFGGNITISGTFTVNGNSAAARVLLRSDTPGTQRTITSAVNTFTNMGCQDINGQGAASWNLAAISGLSDDGGGNSNITTTTPANVYAKTGTSQQWTAAIWFTTSGGASASHVPLLQDTAIFDANSITAGSVTVTIGAQNQRVGHINWTGVTNTPTWAHGAVAVQSFGNVTLVSGMTHTGTGSWTFRGRSSTFDSGTLTWPTSSTLISDSGTGTVTLASNLTSNAGITMTTGTIDTSTYTTNFTALAVNGGTFTFGGNVTTSGTLLVAGGNLTGASNTITGGTSANFTGGTTNIGGWSGTAFTAGAGTVTIGSSGVTCSTSFTKNNTGTATINGASTVTTTIILSSTGVLNLNADMTGSSTFATTGTTLNITDATLAFSGGSIVGAGAGGSGPSSFTFGS